MDHPINLPDFLNSTHLFNGLSRELLDEIAGISIIKKINKNQTIFAEGDDGAGFYIVAQGTVKIFKLSPDGKEQILHIFGPGEPFGEVAVFAGRNFPANATYLQDGQVIFIDRKKFSALLETHPTLAFNMLAILSMRLRKFTGIIESLSLKETPGRLAAFLLMMSQEKKDKDTFILDMTKGQVANTLGTTPETLSRIIKLMDDKGLISYRGKKVSIIDRKQLESLSEGVERIAR